MPAASSRSRRSAAPEAAPIPRVDARPRRVAAQAAAAAIAAVAPVRRVSRVSLPKAPPLDALPPTAAALAAAAAAPPEDENEQRCPVCMDALSTKRSVTLDPCKHEFHRTCATQWLETRCCSGAQQCPLCRAVVVWLREAGQRRERTRAFGDSGQPTKRSVLANAQDRGQETLTYLDARHAEVKHALVRLRAARARYVASASDGNDASVASDTAVVFLTDFDEEVEKLLTRERIYKEMKQAYRAGAMRVAADVLPYIYDEPWSYGNEMADYQVELDIRRQAATATTDPPPQQQPAVVGRVHTRDYYFADGLILRNQPGPPFALQPVGQPAVGDNLLAAIDMQLATAGRGPRASLPRFGTPAPSALRMPSMTARERRAAARNMRAALRDAPEM